MFEEPHSLPLMGLLDHRTGRTGEPGTIQFKQKVSLLVEPLPNKLVYVGEREPRYAGCSEWSSYAMSERTSTLATKSMRIDIDRA